MKMYINPKKNTKTLETTEILRRELLNYMKEL